MTDSILPPDDEVVSAHLDGETTADETALIESALIESGVIQTDGGVRARRAELESVQSLVGAPITVPSKGREDAIAAALDVFDQFEHHRSRSAAVPVDDLGARRAASRRARVLSVAAALIVIVGVLAVLRLSRTSGTTDTATSNAASAPISTTSSGPPSEGAASDSGKARADPGSDRNQPEVAAPTTTSAIGSPAPAEASGGHGSPISRGDLGVITTSDQLRQAIGPVEVRSSGAPPTTIAAPPSPPSPTESDLARCDATMRSQDPELGALIQRATATFRTAAAWVLVYSLDSGRVPSGGTRLFAVERGSCRILDIQTL